MTEGISHQGKGYTERGRRLGLPKKHKKAFRCDECVHYLDYGDSLTDTYMSKLSKLHFKYVQSVVGQFYLKK